MEQTNNQFDNSEQLSYNAINDQMHVVKMDEQLPINDTSCKHENLVADPSDQLGDSIYHGCVNPKCGVGFYVQPK